MHVANQTFPLGIKEVLQKSFPELVKTANNLLPEVKQLHLSLIDSAEDLKVALYLNNSPYSDLPLLIYSQEQLSYMVALLFIQYKAANHPLDPPVATFHQSVEDYAIECSLNNQGRWFGVYQFFYRIFSQRPG